MAEDNEAKPAKERMRGLGRGLSSLFEDEEKIDYATLENVLNIRELPIEFLKPGRNQPRQTFDPERIQELSDSIRERGLLQPILVRPVEGREDEYEIIAGERRWRAAQIARLHQVPVVIKEIDDRTALEISIIENVQRENLSPIEEAMGYQRLMHEFAHTQLELSEIVGKSRSHISNLTRLLNLPEEVRNMLDSGELSASHARSLVSAADPVALARQIRDQGLNVRDAETLVRQSRPRRGRPRKIRPKKVEKDADTLALEQTLSDSLGLKVEVEHEGEGGGRVVVRYTTLEQLDDVSHRLRRPPSGLL